MSEYHGEHYKESVAEKRHEIIYINDSRYQHYKPIKQEPETVEEEKVIPAKKRKSRIFALCMIIFCGLCLISSCFAWTKLWDFLESYETTNQKYAVDEYMKQYKSNDIVSILNILGVKYDDYNTESEYIKFFKKNYTEDVSQAIALKASTSNDVTTYNVCINKNIKLSEFTLSPDGKKNKYGHEGWKAETIQTADELFPKYNSAKVYIPKGAVAYVNGTALTSKYRSSEDYSVKFYDGLDDTSLRPEFEVYDTGSIFLNVPQVTVKDADGNDMRIEEKNGSYYAYSSIDGAELEELKKYAENFSVTHAKFITKDTDFDSVSPYLVQESDYYRKVHSYWNEYYRQHTITYDNLKFSDPIVYDSNHVVIDISFGYHVDIGYMTNDYDVEYTLCLIKINGEWKIASMSL